MTEKISALEKKLIEIQKENDLLKELLKGAVFRSDCFEYELDNKKYKFVERPNTHGSDSTVEDMFELYSLYKDSELTLPCKTFVDEYKRELDFGWKANSIDICHIIPISVIGLVLARIMNGELKESRDELTVFYEMLKMEDKVEWNKWMDVLYQSQNYKELMDVADQLMKYFDSLAKNLFPGVSKTNQEYVKDNIDYFLIKTEQGLNVPDYVNSFIEYFKENFDNTLTVVQIKNKKVSSCVGMNESDKQYHDPNSMKEARLLEKKEKEEEEKKRKEENKMLRDEKKKEKERIVEEKRLKREEDKKKKELEKKEKTPTKKKEPSEKKKK